MAFSDYVSLVFGKKPVWLYRFVVGGVSYHYTSKASGYTTPANRPNTEFPSGQVWTATALYRGEIYQTVKANRNDTYVRMATSNALMAAAIANRDDENMTVDIWQGFIGDTDNEFKLMFTGRVVEIEPALVYTTLICETTISQTRRSSVAQVVQRSCRHAHYFTNADGGGCGLNVTDFQVTADCFDQTGRTLTVPDANTQDDGYYLAGMLEYDSKFYMVEKHVGDQLTIESPVEGLTAAIDADTNSPPFVQVKIAPGCNLTIDQCNARFDNVKNFGGFADMDENPFDGRSIA